ncbi:MAG TPA: hypothetical protein PK969_06555 [Treponemataceae bacterium]|nr:hypothetical protein [Treponemataceae bacterium]
MRPFLWAHITMGAHYYGRIPYGVGLYAPMAGILPETGTLAGRESLGIPGHHRNPGHPAAIPCAEDSLPLQ